MAVNRYPQSCLSANCGQIVCDGCRHRPALAAHYREQGKDFEAMQAKARITVAMNRALDEVLNAPQGGAA